MKHFWQPAADANVYECSKCHMTWAFLPMLNGDVVTDGPEPPETCAKGRDTVTLTLRT